MKILWLIAIGFLMYVSSILVYLNVRGTEPLWRVQLCIGMLAVSAIMVLSGMIIFIKKNI